MPRRQDHASIAFITLLIVFIIFGFKLISDRTFLIAWFCFLIGSLAPDYIEPAYNFRHRSFFHSWDFLKILSVITIIMIFICLVYRSIAMFSIASFLTGYVIHLILDSTTKMGLPKHNKK
jgi:Predicted membrane-bound metal-dependent hydrolase (DUF457).